MVYVQGKTGVPPPISSLQTFSLLPIVIVVLDFFSKLILQMEQVSKPCKCTCATQDHYLII